MVSSAAAVLGRKAQQPVWAQPRSLGSAHQEGPVFEDPQIEILGGTDDKIKTIFFCVGRLSCDKFGK